jgi:hypothetical protein
MTMSFLSLVMTPIGEGFLIGRSEDSQTLLVTHAPRQVKAHLDDEQANKVLEGCTGPCFFTWHKSDEVKEMV